MKKILYLAIAALMTLNLADMKAGEDPHGLYHLKRLIYQNGRTTVPAFQQYKYAADSVGLLVMCQQAPTANQWGRMQIEIRENYPLKNTGETPQGPDGHGTQIFNVNANQFYFKWYNQQWPSMSKLNEFITEVYAKDNINPTVAKAFSMLENKTAPSNNKLDGWWLRIASAPNPDGSGQRQPVQTLWKAYTSDMSIVVYMLNNGNVIGCNTAIGTKYENDTTIYEAGHRCDIHWINKDCHALTFVQEDNTKLTEIWVRGGLPQTWQDIFNTNVPLYKDGNKTIIDAVKSAMEGNLKQAEASLAEATDEKDANITNLCIGIYVIAANLFQMAENQGDKQNYTECHDFCKRQLQKINDYADAGHTPDAQAQAQIHQIEILKALATHRTGKTEEGKQQLEERKSIIDAEINRYKNVAGMESYINSLHYLQLWMYSQAYDILGSFQTIIMLDALTLMAPAITTANKPLLLNTYANCHLLDGKQEEAKKLWQQIKNLNPNYFKSQPANNPLKKTFGE